MKIFMRGHRLIVFCLFLFVTSRVTGSIPGLYAINLIANYFVTVTLRDEWSAIYGTDRYKKF